MFARIIHLFLSHYFSGKRCRKRASRVNKTPLFPQQNTPSVQTISTQILILQAPTLMAILTHKYIILTQVWYSYDERYNLVLKAAVAKFTSVCWALLVSHLSQSQRLLDEPVYPHYACKTILYCQHNWTEDEWWVIFLFTWYLFECEPLACSAVMSFLLEQV